MSQLAGVPAVSRVSMIPLAAIAMPATAIGSRGPLMPVMRPDRGANTTIIAAIGSRYSPACSAE